MGRVYDFSSVELPHLLTLKNSADPGRNLIARSGLGQYQCTLRIICNYN